MKRNGFHLPWLNLPSLLLLALVSACDTRTMRYAAFDDLVVGSYTVYLYTNGECEVEMGLGYHPGRYTMKGDTIYLTYQEGHLPAMPTQFRLTPAFLVTLPTATYRRTIKIPRQ
jgi:hypothetical protein